MDTWQVGDLFIAKYDTLGETLWRTVIGDTATVSATSVTVGRVLIETDDHRYLVGGVTAAYGQGNGDILLAKFDTDGGLIWAKTYGGTGDDDCECITPIGSNQYLRGTQDALFARFDADSGRLIWAKIWGTPGWDFFATMVQSSQSDNMLCGGWVAGDTTTSGDYQNQAAIAMLNPNTGGLSDVWAMGSDDVNDFGRSAIETDEGYLLAGRTWSYGQGESDLSLAKFDFLRQTCDGYRKQIHHQTPNWTAQDLTVKLKNWSMEVESLGEGVVLTPPSLTRETICTYP